MSNISKWSSTDEDNNQVAPNGWPEHQSPSSVNNSARAMMGGIRRAYLEQPYFNPGGKILYVDSATFSVKDTSEITDFRQFYTVGRRIKLLSSTGIEQYGNIGSVRYSGGETQVSCAIDGNEAINNLVSEVYCGLSPKDTEEVIGRLPIGMILPYTAMSLPAGFLYADGNSFDPSIYTGLASLWATEEEDEYLYGQELVGGVYWPKTPDVRGQFPRYLDMGAGVDPDGETRTIGETQSDAIRNITGYAPTLRSGVSPSGAFTVAEGGAGYAAGAEGGKLYFDASEVVPTAEENRPTNIAFPALIVAWHGVIPSENITIQNLLTSFNQMQAGIDTLYTAKDEILEDFEEECDDIYLTTKTKMNTASTSIISTLEDKETELSTSLTSTVNSGISDFNDNATSKTSSYNDNATSKTSSYNDNASSKTTTFNSVVSTATSSITSYVTIATEQANIATQKAQQAQSSAQEVIEAVGGTYANQDLDNLSEDGQAIIDNKADIELSNINVLNETIAEEYVNGNSWYIIYKRPQADGSVKYWCEQGGFLAKDYAGSTNFYVAYTKLLNFNMNNTTNKDGASPDKNLTINWVGNSNFSNAPVIADSGAIWSAAGYCDAPTIEE